MSLVKLCALRLHVERADDIDARFILELRRLIVAAQARIQQYESGINMLPDEMLCEIFSYLGYWRPVAKNACGRWRDILHLAKHDREHIMTHGPEWLIQQLLGNSWPEAVRKYRLTKLIRDGHSAMATWVYKKRKERNIILCSMSANMFAEAIKYQQYALAKTIYTECADCACGGIRIRKTHIDIIANRSEPELLQWLLARSHGASG